MLNMQGDVMMQRVKSVRQGTCKRVKKKDKDKHWHTFTYQLKWDKKSATDRKLHFQIYDNIYSVWESGHMCRKSNPGFGKSKEDKRDRYLL